MPIGATSTLLFIRSNVRDLTKTVSQQQSGIVDPTLNDWIHLAIQHIRSVARTSLRDFYMTDANVSLSTAMDISGYNIFDLSTMRLRLTTNQQIPILKRNVYNSMLASHTFGASQWIATVVTQGSLNQFTLIVGGAASPTGAAILSYERNPIKVTSDSAYIDIPDNLASIVTDLAAMTVWRHLKRQPDVEVQQRIRQFIEEQMRQDRLTKAEA